ncbi:MAG TPA: helix-turn-helix transcriptional regulator [Mycobacteriales bacterium]|nr:helix-turn-helix transcriptional regulator [Mycobacteriales bacterium]
MRAQGRKARPPEVEYRAAFGRAVRARREQTEISQEELALRIGMSRRYLAGIERGESNPSLDQVLRIAIGLDIEVADLLPSRRQRTATRPTGR